MMNCFFGAGKQLAEIIVVKEAELEKL